MSQMRIFVSHCSQDKTFTDALVHALKNAGADVWYDEHNLGAGELLDTLLRELDERTIFIVVLSQAALASEWVLDECKWAFSLRRLDRTRLILPVVAEKIEETDFRGKWLFLAGFTRAEAKSGDNYPSMAEVISKALGFLGLDSKRDTQSEDVVNFLVANGQARLSVNEHDRALSFFDCATQLMPRNFDAWFGKGTALVRMRKLEDARHAFDEARRVRPELAALVWCSLGHELNNASRYESAIEAFESAIDAEPTWPHPYTALGMVLKNLAQVRHDTALFEKSIAASRAAIDLDSLEYAAWGMMAIALRALGREDEAEEAEREELAARKTKQEALAVNPIPDDVDW